MVAISQSSDASSPLSRYQQFVAQGRLKADEGQAQAVTLLNTLFQELANTKTQPGKGRWQKLFGRASSDVSATISGLYLYGGVGRGKTMLMDVFASCLETGSYQRLHFHDFMVMAHNAVQAARNADAADPFTHAAEQLIKAGHIICFDEMEVRDIADAMIVQRLFAALWNKGMVLIATSNRAPDQLYLNGLHRDRFLPFIEQINSRLTIHEIARGPDWRQQYLAEISNWHVKTLDDDCTVSLDAIFARLTDNKPAGPETVTIAARDVLLAKVAGDVADTPFAALCGVPLGARDYLALADRLAGLVIRDIPVLGDAEQNEARRFMWLIDAFYDRGRFLIASAEKPVESLYTGSQWAFEFDRTCSRLEEMARARFGSDTQ
ncbi:MAG: cell division protein ZapE [Alphaproteobacteria bacterium]|nr:cell division protein ZapE [Alphaproteobacteria bacterium]